MVTNTMVHVRVGEKIKVEAIKTLAAMGLTVSDAVRVFFVRVVADKPMPFARKVPNVETRGAMAESDKIARMRRARFSTATERLMTSKKTAASKRASLPRAAGYAKSLKEEWEHLSRGAGTT